MFDILPPTRQFQILQNGTESMLCEAQKNHTLKQVIEWIKAHSEWLNEELPREQWIYEPTNDTFKRVGIKISLEDWQELQKETEK